MLSLRRVRSLRRPTYPLKSRTSKARAEDFARAVCAGRDGRRVPRRRCPNILAAADFKAVVRAIVDAQAARRRHRLGPRRARHQDRASARSLIDLMERGFVSAIATNGAAIIHDFEVALAGATSEDVDEALGPGRFGMADETGRLLNGAINDGVARGPRHRPGGRRSSWRTQQPQFARSSVLAAAARLGIPVTVHVAIGTDIIHMHPAASGAALGEGSLRDFRYFVVERRAARARRLSQLRVGGRPARSVPEGRGARAQPRHRARRPDDREPRFRAALPAADQRRRAADRRHRPRLLARRPPRDHDSAARRG